METIQKKKHSFITFFAQYNLLEAATISIKLQIIQFCHFTYG